MTMAKTVQAKDIPDVGILELVDMLADPQSIGTNRWDIQADLGNFPKKVVDAKLASLVRRGLLYGCPMPRCNCRGDFNVTDVGRELLAP